jgi:hypothetical protein
MGITYIDLWGIAEVPYITEQKSLYRRDLRWAGF